MEVEGVWEPAIPSQLATEVVGSPGLIDQIGA
jgi:hypothetical protein